MQIFDLKSSISVFKALDSDIRIEILDLISKRNNLNINDIAKILKLSNAALTMHIKKLEECGLIDIVVSNGKHGMQKICCLSDDKILIELKQDIQNDQSYEVDLNVGYYSNYQIFPTCGLASSKSLIGEVDDPRFFADPSRIEADIIWFSKGFVEYRIPNYLKPMQNIKEIQISMELASEAPGYCEYWPSDIYLYFNNIELGYWVSPGDFGEKRGIYNPYWWPKWNQHGVLKLLSITEYATFIDGRKLSNIKLDDLCLDYKSDFSLKLAVPDKANNIGGLTIYGNNFGNYNQGIKIRILYENQENTANRFIEGDTK
jgi:predicted transcriptional regulator